MVENGSKTNIWFDSWTPFGPLLKFIGIDGPRSLRLPLNAVVADACTIDGWRLPSPRSDPQLLFHAHLTIRHLPSLSSDEDYSIWVINDVVHEEFTSSKTQDVLRPRGDTKDWYASVWFKGCVPNHAFNMWILTLNRLPTRVRLASWGLNVTTNCCLCSREEENRDHLLLSCEYSSEIWRLVSQHMLRSWPELLSWTRPSTPQAPSLLRTLAAQATVFYVWKQRNNVLHNSQSIPPGSIFTCIDRKIHNIINPR